MPDKESLIDDRIINVPPYSREVAKGEWSEELHPRDESGKFSETGGAGKPDIGADTPHTGVPEPLKTFDGIKTYLTTGTKVIISAEKGGLKPDDNQRRTVGLKRILQNYSNEVVMQEGRWGQVSETSYVVSVKPEQVEELKQLAFSEKELDQAAIIVIKDGDAELLFRGGGSEKGKVSEMDSVADAADNYSKLGDTKYRIKFK